MGARATQRVVLMSIHPQFARGILAGRKRVEFRKTRFSAAISYVVIYATKPVQQIIGFFRVAGVEQDAPEELWRRYQDEGGIARESFMSYYGRRSSGVAIKVGDVFGLRRPRPLSSLGRGLVPPQSFRYLPAEIVQELSADGARQFQRQPVTYDSVGTDGLGQPSHDLRRPTFPPASSSHMPGQRVASRSDGTRRII
jgi:predicted transcriptional regulator